MAEDKQYTETEFHRKMAVDLFNRVWELIEKTDRTAEEGDTMLHAAHASRYHWEQIGTALNLSRGEWQISRVYALLNRAEPALYHARRSLEICERNGIGDFDIAFAHEALARAAAAAQDTPLFVNHYQKAQELGAQIQDADDRSYFITDLNNGPWFGLKERDGPAD